MVNTLKPVEVDIDIEVSSLERGAFYSLCFITKNDIAPRTLVVNTLSDLLENGYTRLDLAYNFCVGVFTQEGISSVKVRAVRSGESYIDAYQSDENDSYYYVVIDSKLPSEVMSFNSYLLENSQMKLHFYSNKDFVGESPNLVNYYQEYVPKSEDIPEGDTDYYIDKAYNGKPIKPPLPSKFIQVFEDNGLFVVPEGVTEVDVLIVAGGGGGGSRQGGGGGAGGVTVLNNYKVSPMSEIPVLVGSGGAGGINGSNGNSGNNSSFDSEISIGGGGGGGRTFGNVGLSGGSGGGGSNSGAGGIPTLLQGNYGGQSPVKGNLAGGGGGATAIGESPSYTGLNDYEGDAGDGGEGIYFEALIDYGDAGYFSGGGGGGGYNTLSGNPEGAGKGGKGGGGDGVVGSDNPSYLGRDGYAGLPNTGGGGGGSPSGSFSGGNGASGVVIVVYPAGQLEPILMAKHAITVGT